MPRPKEYQQEHVLDRATECFWQHGYTATSMKHLEQATGLTPGSLYNSFGSKDGLFLACLDHYNDTVIGERVRHYLKPAIREYQEAPLQGIENFIATAFEPGPAELCLGCLMVNTSVELGPHEETVRQRTTEAMRKVLQGIQYSLNGAQAKGQLSSTVDYRQRAQSLSLMFNGMLVQWRGATDKRWLKNAMTSVRELLMSN
ncbi:TetR/AcrR family transcriptional regulator [Pseudoteredinibacter isoporae]|uniref:TetR/AcrR family transcriptional regulator n=1 Tax=Pseudoteredinibacter isoporae TaxID=570281 RepID=UPI003108D754